MIFRCVEYYYKFLQLLGSFYIILQFFNWFILANIIIFLIKSVKSFSYRGIYVIIFSLTTNFMLWKLKRHKLLKFIKDLNIFDEFKLSIFIIFTIYYFFMIDENNLHFLEQFLGEIHINSIINISTI